jgi:hypothetical protein
MGTAGINIDAWLGDTFGSSVHRGKSGRNTFETTRYFKLIEESESEIFIPRGFIGRLLRFCKESQVEFDFLDERKLKPPIPFAFIAALRNHQLSVIETVSKRIME